MTTISILDAVQLYDCRIALEQIAVVGACESATASQLQNLEQYLNDAEKLLKHKSSELNNFQLLNLDYQFHRLIAESSGNKWLVSLLEQVFDKMTLLRIQTTRYNPKVLEIRIEHRQIYEAIAQRNPSSAAQAIQTHLAGSKSRVVQEVQNLQQTTEALS